MREPIIVGTPNEVFKSEIIEMAFDCPVHIIQHPHYHCPLVIAAKQDEKSFFSAV